MAYRVALYDKRTGKFVGYSTHGNAAVNRGFGAYGRAGGNKLFKTKQNAQSYARNSGYKSFKTKVVEVKRATSRRSYRPRSIFDSF